MATANWMIESGEDGCPQCHEARRNVHPGQRKLATSLCRAALPRQSPAAGVAALIHIRPDLAADQTTIRPNQIRASECPFVRSRRSHRPLPLRRTTSPYPCAVQAARGGTRPRVHLPNSPRHHAGTSAAGMRSRTGRYECRHHTRPTAVAGVNNRRYTPSPGEGCHSGSLTVTAARATRGPPGRCGRGFQGGWHAARAHPARCLPGHCLPHGRVLTESPQVRSAVTSPTRS